MIDLGDMFCLKELQESTNNGEGVKVAVIDTGIPSAPGTKVSYFKDFTPGKDSNPDHASRVGSIMFGNGEILGICNNADSCFCKVFDGTCASPKAVADAIEAAVEWGADIINLSLGFSGLCECPPEVESACRHAYDAGTMLVAASGVEDNYSFQMNPAALPYVIGVDKSEWHSLFHPSDIKAAGEKIPSLDSDGEMTVSTGTSFAAAVASGALALLIAKGKKLDKTYPRKLFRQLKKLDLSKRTATTLMIDRFCGKIKAFTRKVVTTFTRRTH